jgi:hypothetical protein
MRRSLKKNSVYVLARDDTQAWVSWFDICNPHRAIDRPRLGDVLVYLGRGSEIVKGRGKNAKPDSWCFLRGAMIAEVYNDSLLQCIEEAPE